MQRAAIEMSFTELFTLYLSIGAPFGVHYFFRKRGETGGFSLYFKSLGAALLWFLFAAQFLFTRLISLDSALMRKKRAYSRPNEIEIASQNLQNSFVKLINYDGNYSFFEFRELLERYVGLTLALHSSSLNAPAPEHELEIFRVLEHRKGDLIRAGRILHRKNYQRLQSHQMSARSEFLEVYQSLKENFLLAPDGKLEAWQQYQTEAERLAQLLGDLPAFQILRREGQPILAVQPTIFETNGKQEQDLWKTLQPSASIKTFPVRALTGDLSTQTPD